MNKNEPSTETIHHLDQPPYKRSTFHIVQTVDWSIFMVLSISLVYESGTTKYFNQFPIGIHGEDIWSWWN